MTEAGDLFRNVPLLHEHYRLLRNPFLRELNAGGRGNLGHTLTECVEDFGPDLVAILTQAVEQKKVKVDAALYQKIANAWLAAREYTKALEPMQRAFDLSSDANIGARISDIHLQRNDWVAAESAAQKALAKGGLQNAGGVKLNLGIALYNQNKLDEARAAFEQAAAAGERQYARAYLQAIATRQGKS